MTQQDYQHQHQGFCKHTPWVQDGRVWLSNDDDGYYSQDFINREEVEELISKLRASADEAWPETDTWNAYCEASLDLSNQDDVGEYQSFDTVEELIEDLHDE